MALIDDLQNSIKSLDEFKSITIRILGYIPEVISNKTQDRDYIIIQSNIGSTKKFARPYNSILYIDSIEEFISKYDRFEEILTNLNSETKTLSNEDHLIINSVSYTIQQSIGIALDLLGNQNANRKHVGNRFEELIRLIIQTVGIQNKKIVLKIPYEDGKVYSCETDLVFSPYNEVKSDNTTIDEREVVVSLKTTSKDRMGKIFIDKILMSKFVKRDVKVVGIFLNDIQRKQEDKISYTFVAGLFMVYTNFLTKLDGVFFIDPPPNALKEPYSSHIKRFSDFLITDLWDLISN